MSKKVESYKLSLKQPKKKEPVVPQEETVSTNWLDEITNIDSLRAAIERNLIKIKNSKHEFMIGVYKEENAKFEERIKQIKMAPFEIGVKVLHKPSMFQGIITAKEKDKLVVTTISNTMPQEIKCYPDSLLIMKH